MCYNTLMGKITVDTIKKRLDIMMRAVRYRDSADGRHNECVTCHKVFEIKELQCGHFIKRGNIWLKYKEHNVYPQCVRCNKFLDGAQDKMAYHVIQQHGIEVFNSLIETDYMWQNGELPSFKAKDYVDAYNFWLEYVRDIEEKYTEKLIPKSWEKAE